MIKGALLVFPFWNKALNILINVYKYEDLPPQLVANHSSNLFYCPSWLSVLREHYGCQYYATLDDESNELMLFALIKCLAGRKLVSMPFSDYTCPGLLKPQALREHVEALRKKFPDLPVLLKVSFPGVSGASFGSLGTPADLGCLHRVNTGREVNIEKNMAASFKRGVRRARSRGLKLETTCSREGLEQFYNLFYELRMQKLGLIPQPFAFFEKVFEEFIEHGKGFFIEVRKEGRLLASALVLSYQNGLYYKWGCSSQKDLIDRPNNLLFYELLHQAQREGYDYVDLGLSDRKVNRGLIRFKRSMGGKESPINTFEFLPDGYPSETMDQFKSIVNSMASIVVASQFDRKTTESFSQTLYPLFT